MTTKNDDRLLTEIERQEKYLAKLPDDFNFPLFNAARALESQRRSGYRNTAAAGREIVDNAMEAGATRIDICFERPSNPKAHQRTNSIRSMAFIDNGSGMLPKMARYALSWGSGTHFDDPAFIGKFGFGLPNASINQTQLVEVYTKVEGVGTITKATLDARHVSQHGVQTIGEPEEADLPAFVQRYLDKQGLPFDHGTVVVWVEPDRLTYRLVPTMKEHLVDDFAVTYRYLLENVDLMIDGVKVEPIDPLFLTPGARFYLPEEKGGAIKEEEYTIPVKYSRDPESGTLELSRVTDDSELNEDDPNLEAAGVIYAQVSRFPYGFAVDKSRDTHKIGNEDAYRRFEIRKTRRGMSFVRAGREIQTVDVFPTSIKDQAKGMRNWPLLQSYAYHWGIEIRFDPALDEIFGITNDKQTVRPIEDLWRVLAEAEIDKQLGREQAHQRKIRQEANENRKAAQAKREDTPTDAERASADADSSVGTKPRVSDKHKEEARTKLEAEARKKAKSEKISIEAALKALQSDAKKRPYVIDFFDEKNGPFYRPEWAKGSQIAVKINRKHSFFQTLYAPLMDLKNGDPAKQALDVLLIALARAELTVDDDQAADWYETQREQRWSVFLANAYRSLQRKSEPVDEESAEDDAAGEGSEEEREAA